MSPGFFQEEENPAVLEKIRAAKPDILIVGMGAPKQELWIRRHLDELGVPVVWGVGGLLDYSAKGIERAPLWMRQSGLEWLWRLCLEPRRLWKRYLLGNIVFTFRVVFLSLQTPYWRAPHGFYPTFYDRKFFPKLSFLPEFIRKDLNPLENYVIALPFIIVIWIIICASLDSTAVNTCGLPWTIERDCENGVSVHDYFDGGRVSDERIDLGRAVLVLRSVLALSY